MNPNFEITFTPKERSEFRADNKPAQSIEAKNISFSEEKDSNQPHPAGKKAIELYTEGKSESIGSITYDYPSMERGSGNMFRVRFTGVDSKYSGQELALRLYEQLITLAKSKGMDGIRSDSVVQAGALATWKKLVDRGYDVQVNPEVEEQWQAFLQAYSEGKYYKGLVSTNNTTDSVFRLFLNKGQE
jgi:hypothetical protein